MNVAADTLATRGLFWAARLAREGTRGVRVWNEFIR